MRPARADEAALVSDLALRSKSHWDYPQEWLDKFRDELAFGPDDVLSRRMVVAESGVAVIGFYTIDGEPPDGELGNMWLEPECIGTGLGRRLWTDAIATAKAAGFATLSITADPNAEGFYLAMGARRVGEAASGSIPGRLLPLLEVNVA
jgi:GNAT superfamily N-acetyltransferase